MADIRINALATTATASASDDYLAIDGTANGTRKLSAYSPTLGGSLGLGGSSPSAWDAAVFKLVQFPNGSAVGDIGGYASLSNNYYNNAGDKYIANGYATRYYTGGGSFVWNTAGSGTAGSALSFSTAMTLNNSGNLSLAGNLTVSGTTGIGVGAALSSWWGSARVVQLTGGSVWADSANLYLSANGYYNGSNWIYSTNSYLASVELAGGDVAFKLAASGTAGNTASLTQAMTLKNSGNLLIGTTTDSSNGKLQLATHTTSAGGIGFGTDTSLYRSAGGVLWVDGLGGLTTSQVGLAVAGALKGLFAFVSPDLYIDNRSTGSTIFRTNGTTTALTLDSSQRTILSGALRLNNAYTASVIVPTGYVTIQDSTGTTYKVAVSL